MPQPVNKILNALFDIKPVDETGQVDVRKIEAVSAWLNLSKQRASLRNAKMPFVKPKNQKPAEADFGLKLAQRVSSGIDSDLSVAKKETPTKGASSGSLKTRSLCSKTALTPGLSTSYSNDLFVSRTNVDNPDAPVDPTGLAPVTPDVKAGYLLHNTTGPFPGLEKNYHEQTKKQNQIAELESYLNSNLNVRRELKSVGGKTILRKKMGKPRYRPIFVRQKSGMVDDYQPILSQINRKLAPVLEVALVGEPRRIDPFEGMSGMERPVAASPEIESWVRYVNNQLPITNYQSIFNFKLPKPVLPKLHFGGLISRSLLAYVLTGLLAYAVFTSFGQYGSGVKDEVLRESNLAVANLEQADENLRVFDFEAASDNFAEAYEEFSKAGNSLNFMGA